MSERILHSQSVTYTKYGDPKRWNQPGLDHWWKPNMGPQIGFRSIKADDLHEPLKSAIVLDAKDYTDGTKVRITTRVALIAGMEATNDR